MQDFVVVSLVASVVLTLLLNVLPRLFPKTARKTEQAVHQRMEEAFEQQPRDGARVKVFFPWKAMLAISVGLTVVVNLVSYFAT